jgi:hypothetical protein
MRLQWCACRDSDRSCLVSGVCRGALLVAQPQGPMLDRMDIAIDITRLRDAIITLTSVLDAEIVLFV